MIKKDIQNQKNNKIIKRVNELKLEKKNLFLKKDKIKKLRKDMIKI